MRQALTIMRNRFHRHLSQNLHTFLELCHRFSSTDSAPSHQKKSPATRGEKTIKILTNLLTLIVWGFLQGLPVAEAQVGVIPEGEVTNPELSEIVLKLVGHSCESKVLEATLLEQEGVIEVDVKTKKDHAIVYYQPDKVTPQAMKNAISQKNAGCFYFVVKADGADGAKDNKKVNKEGSNN